MVKVCDVNLLYALHGKTCLQQIRALQVTGTNLARDLASAKHPMNQRVDSSPVPLATLSSPNEQDCHVKSTGGAKRAASLDGSSNSAKYLGYSHGKGTNPSSTSQKPWF